MRILLVNKFHYLNGGSEKYYFELGRLLKEHGNEVAYFSMKDDRNIKTGDKEYFAEKIDLNTGSKLKAFDVIYSKENYKKMQEAIDDFKPDIVHLNNFQRQLSASIVNCCKKNNIPMVFTAHDMQAICPASAMLYKGKICEDCIKNGYNSCIKKSCIKDSKLKSILGVLEAKYYRKNKIYSQIDFIVTPSEFLKKQLIKGNLKYKRIETIHNFVINSEEENNCNDSGYAFFFGRLSIEKGILNVLKAIKQLNNGKLIIAGDGPEKEKIEKFITENNLEDRVKMVGYLKQEQVKEYIKKSRFVVLPSIWYENCPYSILETMEIGKPIIGSKIGGIPELIEDKENGFVYEYNNTDELAEKMKILFDDSEKAHQQGEMSRKLYEEKYSEKIYYNKILKIYTDLIKERKNV